MTVSKSRRRFLWHALAAGVAALAAAACSSEKAQPDCVPAPASKPAEKGAKYEMTPLGGLDAEKKDNDWCRACVMGPKGYASCQRVYGDTPTEAREVIRVRARDKACADAGFPKDACPASATIGIVCKGDPPPPNAGDPAKILQGMYKQLNPPPAPSAPAGAPPASAPAPQ
jgi:hypothetical protein